MLMLSRVANTGLSISSKLIQQPLKSNWIGRSITTLCPNYDNRGLNFIEASKKNTFCTQTIKEKRVPHHVPIASDGSPDEPSFGEALLPWNQINPLYPFRKGLLKPNSMLHPNHPINWGGSPSSSSTHNSSSGNTSPPDEPHFDGGSNNNDGGSNSD